MHISTTLLSLIVATAAALPQGLTTDVKPWAAAGPSDSRGPCPMLNTLANHGYLPHSGRNLTITGIADGINIALNFDVAFGQAFAAQAFALLGLETIDLEDLGTADVTEHRASLTRNDASSGDSLRLDPGRLEALLADSGTGYLDAASLARSRARVEALSGPPALEGLAATQALGEAALLLLAMADGPVPLPEATTNGTAGAAYDELRAPKDRVAAWLGAERLPVEQGWRAAERALTVEDVRGVSAAVAAAQAGLASA